MRPDKLGRVDNFDWVAARAAGSVERLFGQLKADVKADVEAAETQRDSPSRFSFKTTETGNSISVHLSGRFIAAKKVTFTYDRNTLSVSNGITGAQMFSAKPVLDKTGHVRLHVTRPDGPEEKKKSLWQLRYMALEEMFFSEKLDELS